MGRPEDVRASVARERADDDEGYVTHFSYPTLPQPPALRWSVRLMKLGAVLSAASVVYVPTQADRLLALISSLLVSGASAADLTGAQIMGSVFAGIAEVALWLYLAKSVVRGKRWARRVGAALLAAAWLGVVLGWPRSLPEMRVLGLLVAGTGTLVTGLLFRESVTRYLGSVRYLR